MDDLRQSIFSSLKGFLIDTVGEEELSRLPRIGEFGCGKQGFIRDYKRPDQEAFAIDLFRYEQLYEPFGVNYLRSDGKKIPMMDGYFDLIVTHSTLEHVTDLLGSLTEIHRVLKRGGLLYATVSPLYYSPNGSHHRSLPDWDHLRPGSDHFMMSEALENKKGTFLNKLTMSELLGAIGKLPFNILRMDRTTVKNAIPPWLAAEGHDPLDLLTREFRIVLRKLPFRPVYGEAG